MPTATAYDTHVEQLFDRMHQLHRLLSAAGISYRIVGGLAFYLHVAARNPLQAPLTAESARLQLSPPSKSHQSPIKFVCDDEFKNSGSLPNSTAEGILLAPVADLVHMKLTSFRLKDKVHIQDLDNVGLITPEIEASLPATLLARLQRVRATE